jgi:Xaa-Pro dipeptidase
MPDTTDNSQPTQLAYLSRQARLTTALPTDGLDALVLNPGPSLIYLTGLHFHLMERPVVVIFTNDQPPTIILPELEIAKLASLPFQVQAFTYNDDPANWSKTYRQAAQATRLDSRRIGVEPARLRVLELRFLEAAAPQAQFISAEASLASLRMRKETSEVAAMRKAVDIAQRALQDTLPHVRQGMTEHELASELTLQLLRAGSDSEMPFTPIVSSGPNSANPHATPSQRPLSPGDLLVIDWGASYQGYLSDLTRTFAVGDVRPELGKIANLVHEANTAGRLACNPGIPAGEVDRAGRSVIEAAGYGKYFTHRIGHGLGMEGHEEPYIHPNNPLTLEPGMTFTVEPGVYLPNDNGVRIEDDMVITETGAESLSDLPRELKVLGG